MSDRIVVGDKPLLSNVFFVEDGTNRTVTLRNGDSVVVPGNATDPTTVALVVTAPDNTVSTFTYAGTTISKFATGVFDKQDLTVDQVGTWRYEWTGTGTAADVQDGSFTVFAAADNTTYATLELFRSWLGLDSGSGSDLLLGMALGSASRAVDGYCQRKFSLDVSPVTRTFVPDDLLNLRGLPDIGSTSGLVVKTDASGDGTFEIVWGSSDYQLLPQNAPYATPEAKPWTAIRAVGTKTFPWLVNTWLTRFDRVSITARWGWPETPFAVTQATLIKAARLYNRKDSPQGVAGFDQFGPVRISKQEDPDVVGLLSDYQRESVLVA